ncbi:MAG: AsmA family protein, partial [Bacteroidetes bacterium]|nr:AsmA family protein [Bacteroidota bacterium]
MGKVRRATAGWAKLLLKGTGVLILFLAVLLLLLSLPMVQTGIANFATKKLSKQTDSRIEIDRVHINFIKGLALRNLYLEDPSGDTLIYAGLLKVDIALPLLLKRKVQIDRVLLDKATLHLVQDTTGKFNFQHLTDRFASQDPDPKEPPGKPFEISIKSILIGDLYGTADLKDGANSARLEKLEVQMNSMDPGAGLFDVRLIEIDRLSGSSTWNSAERKASQKSPQKKISGFPLDNLPVTILCDKLLIRDSRVNYNRGATGPSPYFDAKRLHGDNLNLEIHDVRLDSTAAAASIRNIRL